MKPGDDFYRFANGSWLKSASIPAGRSHYGFFTMTDERLDQDLLTLMQPTNTPATADHVGRVVHALFASGLDQEATDSIGLEALAPELRLIDSIETMVDVPPVLAHLHRIGVAAFFKIHRPLYWELAGTNYLYLRQRPLGPADNTIVGETPDESNMRDYRDFVTHIFEHLCEDPTLAAARADQVIGIERQLAAQAMSADELRDFKANYNLLNHRELRKLLPGFDWKAFFSHLGAGEVSKVLVGQPAYFTEIGRVLVRGEWPVIRAYLKWVLVLEYAPHLSSDFERSYRTFTAAMTGSSAPVRTRAAVMVDIVNRDLPEAMGALYLRRFFPDSTRIRVVRMFENLKRAFADRIRSHPWLTSRTRNRACKKLEAMRLRLGGPPMKLSHSELRLEDRAFVRNLMHVREYRMRDHLSRVGQPIDRSEWTVTAQSTNAWYQTSRNEIVLPAGGINELFRAKADAAFNYGVLGSRIAHEMTHGFDQQGRLYDDRGRRKNWWSNKDVELFKNAAQKLVEYYSEFAVSDGTRVNGQRTLGENIADLGGLSISFDAYLLSLDGADAPVIDGFTGRQRFFLAYAQKWRELLSEKAMQRRLAGWHAPPRFRTNGPVYQHSGFYESFPEAESGCMSVREDGRITIW